MLLIDIAKKFRNTYAPLVAEDPRILGIYTKKMKEFQADMQDEMIMQYMIDECDFLKEVARIKMSRLAWVIKPDRILSGFIFFFFTAALWNIEKLIV